MIDDSTLPFQSEIDYLRLRQKLVMFFERKRCPEAEDLADESIRRLIGFIKDKGLPNDLNNFALGIARNVWLEWLRKSGGVVQRDGEEQTSHTPSIAREHWQSLVVASVQLLSEGDRDLLEEYFIDGASAEVIAAKHGLSPEGIRSRVYRAKRKLTSHLMSERNLFGLQTKRPSVRTYE